MTLESWTRSPWRVKYHSLTTKGKWGIKLIPWTRGTQKIFFWIFLTLRSRVKGPRRVKIVTMVTPCKWGIKLIPWQRASIKIFSWIFLTYRATVKGPWRVNIVTMVTRLHSLSQAAYLCLYKLVPFSYTYLYAPSCLGKDWVNGWGDEYPLKTDAL